MANKGRTNRGAGRNTSFGKRQKADDDFRGRKKEGRSSGPSFGRKRDSDDRPKRGTGGSSYAGGRRNFSAGPRSSERPAPRGGSRPEGRPERRSFDGDKRKSFGGDDKKPFRKKPFGDRSTDKKPYERKSYGDRSTDKKPYERKSYGDRSTDKKPYERKSYGDKSYDKKPYEKKSFDKKPFDKDDKKPYRKRTSEDKPFERKAPRKKPFEKRSFVESKVESHRERVERPTPADGEAAADGLIRLNKFISNSGVCSRREADELIKLGVITVNGTTITEMGYKVKPTDDVRHDGKRLTAEPLVYILLNKPKGFITTTDDPQERNTVMELIAGACKERVYPVGRLDRNTTGLLLLTNDGDLTDKLTHPSFNAKKIYKVELDRPLAKDDFQKILDGVPLEEGKALVDDLAIVSDDSKTVGIELHIGWNHIVRRIFDALEYSVLKLDRVVYAGLDKKDLKRGQWRFLKNEEIVRIKHFK
jgi:23S rRNA pseudouridine2605 synthase